MAVERRVVVVGGGIAGLSVLAGLARAGVAGVLLEAEPVIGAHASGRNAAIHRSLEADRTTAHFIAPSRALMAGIEPGGHLRRTGLLLAAGDPACAAEWAARARERGIAHRLVAADAVAASAVHLAGGEVVGGVWLDDGGVLDIHAMLLSLAERSRAAGAALRTGVRVAGVEVAGGRVRGVALEGGASVPATDVVLAAGAWARALGAECGCPLPLSPVRRHLVQLGAALPPDAPVVWRVDSEVYLRPEGQGTLCSPCDATPWGDSPPLDDPPSDPGVLERLAGRLGATAPSLSGAEVLRYWACLRTFASDGEPIAGPDPRLRGLHWLTGLGGRGMSVGPGVGQFVADRLLGRKTLEVPAILADRLV